MNWKSFKEEKPLEDQRVLIYSSIFNIFYVEIFFAGKHSPDNAVLLTEFWCPVPSLPDDILKDVRNPIPTITTLD